MCRNSCCWFCLCFPGNSLVGMCCTTYFVNRGMDDFTTSWMKVTCSLSTQDMALKLLLQTAPGIFVKHPIFFFKSFRLLSSHCIRTQQKSYKWHWNNIHLTTIMKKQGWNLDWLTDNGCNDYSNHHNKNYPHLTEWNKNNTLNYGNQTCTL